MAVNLKIVLSQTALVYWVLSEERSGISIIYASIAGIISLSLPLGIQSMIGFISSGQVSTSVIVLVGFILIGILVTGGLQVMQLYLVEHIQQKLYARTAFEFAYSVPKMRLESLMASIRLN